MNFKEIFNLYKVNNKQLAVDKQIIQMHMNEILDSNNQIIYVDKSDFEPFPKLYMRFVVNKISKFKPIYPKLDYKVNTLLMSISSDQDIKLVETHQVEKSIRKTYGNDVNIIYNFVRNEDVKELKLGIFIID
jgi:hypothetical protein